MALLLMSSEVNFHIILELRVKNVNYRSTLFITCILVKCKMCVQFYKNFQFGARLARSHIYDVYLGVAVGSGTASVCGE